MMDAVCMVGLFGGLFLYLLGRVLYPDEQAGFRPIIPEPNNMLAEAGTLEIPTMEEE